MSIIKLKSKTLISSSQSPIFSFLNPQPKYPLFAYTQTHNYVNVYMKWKKDSFYDSIDHIHKSIELKSIISLKNVVVQNPNGCIPISDVSKKGFQFDVKIRVAKFLRQYPSIFEEFIGPKYNLPWFRLTKEAALIDKEEKRVFEESKDDLRDRLKKFILMSEEKVLPFSIVQGMLWYLGLPEDFLQFPDKNFDGYFRIVDLKDGMKGLGVIDSKEKIFSVLQRNAMRKGVYKGETMESIEFPLFPSKGLRLKRKIKVWLKEFQKLPYVSPYEDYSDLDRTSDIAEKRVVGFFHELLCLFVEHSAERKKLLCLKKHFGLPQKMHKAFERHPHMFYLSMRNHTCTAILKEACVDGDGEVSIERHPMLAVRQKYIQLIKESQEMLKSKNLKNQLVEGKLSSDSGADDRKDEEIVA